MEPRRKNIKDYKKKKKERRRRRKKKKKEKRSNFKHLVPLP
jgi:hypothetical protein